MPTNMAAPPHILRCTYLEQNFLVPVSVMAITVTLYGGSGGGADNMSGRGGMISSVIPVTPGEVLMVMVGSAGQVRWGGYNGGGNGGSGGGSTAGGGATDIRRNPYALADRILIAGGGGGRGYDNDAVGGEAGVEATR